MSSGVERLVVVYVFIEAGEWMEYHMFPINLSCMHRHKRILFDLR